MVILQDCDIVVCDYSICGGGVIHYVVIGDNMISFNGDINGGSRPRGYDTVEAELPAACVRVYRPKHVTDTFNGSYDDERIYECIYSKDHPSLVKAD